LSFSEFHIFRNDDPLALMKRTAPWIKILFKAVLTKYLLNEADSACSPKLHLKCIYKQLLFPTLCWEAFASRRLKSQIESVPGEEEVRQSPVIAIAVVNKRAADDEAHHHHSFVIP
jgi:hypothetical protein